ncbi:MAG TPA: histone deacetylase family protein [Spirochaetota bacterium]|nr:histone deacetylase family protein [Spirochaetota bacterium]
MDTEKLRDIVRIVYHPSFVTNYSTASCESPDRVQSIMATLKDQFDVVEPEQCTDEDILLCHSEGLLMSEKINAQRFDIAKRAAGGAIKTAELALEGFISFGVIRPPGHHANPDHNWGFCFFNNMGIAVTKLLNENKISTAVVFDIDLHFGDGTDVIFKGNSDVKVLNIQSSNPGDFINEAKARLADIGDVDIIGISAGFDQYEKDWGANLSTDDYRIIGAIAGTFAKEHANNKIFAILEGGYYIPDLGNNVYALIEGISEARLS